MNQEAETVTLEASSKQAKELQKAFENLRAQMRSTKARLEVGFAPDNTHTQTHTSTATLTTNALITIRSLVTEVSPGAE